MEDMAWGQANCTACRARPQTEGKRRIYTMLMHYEIRARHALITLRRYSSLPRSSHSKARGWGSVGDASRLCCCSSAATFCCTSGRVAIEYRAQLMAVVEVSNPARHVMQPQATSDCMHTRPDVSAAWAQTFCRMITPTVRRASMSEIFSRREQVISHAGAFCAMLP